MPREFLPMGRKREHSARAELFPRTDARVMAGPPCDRMVREPAVDRHLTKARLREIAMESPGAAIENVTD